MKVGVWASMALLAGFALVGTSCLEVLGGDYHLDTAGSGGTSGSGGTGGSGGTSGSGGTGGLGGTSGGPPCDGGAAPDLGKSAEACMNDGNGSFTTSCKTGYVVIGAFVYAETYIGRFGVLCAPIVQGVPKTCAAEAACWAGNSATTYKETTYKEEMCPPGQAVVKLGYAYGNDEFGEYEQVDQLTLYCQQPSSWMSNNPTPDSTAGPIGGKEGSHDGSPLSCPPGQVATGFSGKIMKNLAPKLKYYLESLSGISCTTP